MSVPFMVDAEAGQPGDGVSLHQLLQADCTFSGILGQHVLWRTRQETDTGPINTIRLNSNCCSLS